MAETPLGRDLHDAVGSLVALARAGGDPAEVEASLLEVQSLFQALITGIHVALAAIADGPDAIGMERFSDIRSIAMRRVEAIIALVDELPQLGVDHSTDLEYLRERGRRRRMAAGDG